MSKIEDYVSYLISRKESEKAIEILDNKAYKPSINSNTILVDSFNYKDFKVAEYILSSKQLKVIRKNIYYKALCSGDVNSIDLIFNHKTFNEDFFEITKYDLINFNFDVVQYILLSDKISNNFKQKIIHYVFNLCTTKSFKNLINNPQFCPLINQYSDKEILLIPEYSSYSNNELFNILLKENIDIVKNKNYEPFLIDLKNSCYFKIKEYMKYLNQSDFDFIFYEKSLFQYLNVKQLTVFEAYNDESVSDEIKIIELFIENKHFNPTLLNYRDFLLACFNGWTSIINLFLKQDYFKFINISNESLMELKKQYFEDKFNNIDNFEIFKLFFQYKELQNDMLIFAKNKNENLYQELNKIKIKNSVNIF